MRCTVITVGGPPGSGTTTVCRLLSQQTGLEHLYVGQLFRNLASEYGMSLEKFGPYVRAHPEIDRRLEEMQVERARAGSVILEGRLSGWAVRTAGIEALKVWLDADPLERARRVSRRDGQEIEEAARRASEREAGDRERYLEVYGVDLADLSIYDLVVDTTAITPEQVVAMVLKHPSIAWWRASKFTRCNSGA